MSGTTNTAALKRLLVTCLHVADLELTPIAVKCAWPVFKASLSDGRAVFVKLTSAEAAARTLSFLADVKDCAFLPRAILSRPPVFEDYVVLCLDWLEGARVDAEKMTDAQAESFLESCVRLSQILAAYDGAIRPLAAEDSPEGEFSALADYARRHRLVGRLLKPLLTIPAADRSFATRRLVKIHGDLQPRNYGFDGDRLSAVYDTDDLTEGLACEDAAYAFTERARKSALSRAERARLTALFLKVVSASPWPLEEWRVAVNHARLTIAARRLAKRPDSSFIAFDIRRRDKPLQALAEALGRLHA